MDAELLAVGGGETLHFADVRARHKAAARACEDDHIDVVIGRDLVDGGIQVVENLAVEGVEGLLTVNGQNPHMALLLNFDKSHTLLPPYVAFLRFPIRIFASISIVSFPSMRKRQKGKIFVPKPGDIPKQSSFFQGIHGW